jgi:hypothetical protein
MSQFVSEQRPAEPGLPLWSYELQKRSRLAVRTRYAVERALVTRALKDSAFRSRLLANPKALVEEELGTEVAPEIHFHVLEESSTSLYFVVPVNPYEAMDEKELEALLGITWEDVAQWTLGETGGLEFKAEKSARLIARAWRDKSFRAQLVESPRRAIAEELGISLPDNITITVALETSTLLYLVLPEPARPETYEWDVPETALLSVADVNLLMIGSGSTNATACSNNCKPPVTEHPKGCPG